MNTNDMLEFLIYPIITGILWATIVVSEPYQWLLDLIRLNRKPFNCPLCLSFWTFWIYGIATDPVIMLYAGVAALAASLTEKELYRI
jgi:hypothetical protein